MVKTGVLFVNLIAIFMMLSLIACGDSTANKTVSSNNEWDGTLILNVGPEGRSIDPTLASSTFSIIYTTQLFEGLTTKNFDGELVPGVAERWTISDDGLTYTFYLRKNAKWSDGKIVTAEDFLYTWRRVVDPKVAAEYSYHFGPIKNARKIVSGDMPIESLGVSVIDAYTFQVVLEVPTTYFLETTSFPTFYPVRKDIVEANPEGWTLDPKTFISNGPFKVIERVIDSRIVMAKNTEYWNKDAVKPSQITFLLMDSPSTALAGVKEGSIHFSTSVPVAEVAKLREEGLIQTGPNLASSYWEINNTNGVLKDYRIRRALSLSVDRNYIADKIFNGNATLAGAFVPYGLDDVTGDFRENGGDYFSVQPEDYQKNVLEAKRLLTEAGYPDGKNFPVIEIRTFAGDASEAPALEAAQQMWKEELGIDVIIAPQEEWAVYQTRLKDGDFHIARLGWGADYKDPMTFLEIFSTDSAYSYARYSNPEYDKLIQIAKQSSDQKIRMEAMHKAEEIIINDMGLLPLSFRVRTVLINKQLRDVPLDALGQYNFSYAYLEN